MKVLHLLKTSDGASWAVRQMRELVHLGVEVHAALPPGGPQISKCHTSGVITHVQQTDFPVRRPWQLPQTVKTIRRLVDEIRPDVIHSHFVGTTLAVRLALGRHNTIPRIFQVPGPLHLEHGPFGTMELSLAGLADYWIASCAWTRDRYKEMGVRADRVFLSHYGTDMADFAVAAGKLRSELRLSPETKLVGLIAYMYPPKYYLGQFRGIKGHEDYLQAMALVRRKEANCFGLVVGAQWGPGTAYEHRLRQHASRLVGDGVVFLGLRNDVPAIYADLDVAVHPSLSENLGGAAESMLAGVPTVATRVGGLTDLVQDSVTGWLVPPRSPVALSEAILSAISDRKEATRRAICGQTLARKLLDVRKTARDVLAVYQRVLTAGEAAPRSTVPENQRRAA